MTTAPHSAAQAEPQVEILRLFDYYEPSEKQTLAHKAVEKHILYGGAIGGGKAITLDTPILTTSGWTVMGAISPGDFVYGPDGKPTEVIWCSEIMLDRPCYRVIFDDGSEIVCDEEHLWRTQTCQERIANTKRTPEYREKRRAKRASTREARNRTGRTRPDLALANSLRDHALMVPTLGGVRTTKEIFHTLWYEHGRYRQINHAIPNSEPIDWPKSELPIPPYTLGAWLGDGNTRDGGFTSADPQVIERICRDGFEVRKNAAKYHWHIQHLLSLLRKAGVYGNKHIPQCYLQSSVQQRLELLQGLMDTDGYVKLTGSCVYYTMLSVLAENVCELLVSLGIKVSLTDKAAKLNGKSYGRCFLLTFRTSMPVCHLPRKAKRLKPVEDKRVLFRYIVSVEPCVSVPVRCLQVARQDGMFLIGRSLIPTHNSCWIVMDALINCLLYIPNRVGIFRYEYSNFMKTTYNTLCEWLLEGMKNPIGPRLVASHNQQRHEIKLINGSSIIYGGLKPDRSTSGDPLSVIKSLELNAAYVDEVTDVPQKVFEFLTGRVPRIRVRSVRTGQTLLPPPRIGCTCNPHLGWVKERWVDKKLPDHVFVPARAVDNFKHLGQVYLDSLYSSFGDDKEAIERYIEGSWDAVQDYDAIFPQQTLVAAAARKVAPGFPCEVGIDVAAGGRDSSVILVRRGFQVRYVYVGRNKSTMDVVGIMKMYYDRQEQIWRKVRKDTNWANLTDQRKKLALAAAYAPLTVIRIDAIGVGKGPYDRMAELGLPVIPFIGGATAESDGFMNARAEAYWAVRVLLEKGLLDLPDDSELINEAGSIKYHRSASDRTIQVESKTEIQRRIGHSPDKTDALVYTFGTNPEGAFDFQPALIVRA